MSIPAREASSQAQQTLEMNPTVPHNTTSPASQSALRILEYTTQHGSLGLAIFDQSGLCHWANPAMAPLLGLDDAQTLVGRLSCWEHCSVPDAPEDNPLEQAFRGAVIDVPALEYHLGDWSRELVDAAPVRVSARAFPLVDDYGKALAVYVFHQKLRTANPVQSEWEEQLLNHSIAMARRMSIRTAHDFNNIIAVVQGYASILRSRMTEDKDNQELAGFIETAGAEALELTNWFSSFANQRVREPVALNLDQTVGQFITRSRETLPDRVELRVSLSNIPNSVLADEAQLEQVCQHLWENAIDAMPEGGALTWETSLVPGPGSASPDHPEAGPGQYLRLRVQDSGTGMDEATRKLVFEPFFTTKAGRFRGLGLTLVYDTVRSYQGWVSVSSAPGNGTCIEVNLPALPAPAEPGAPEHSQAAAGSTRRVMVVDDEAMIRRVLQDILKSMGYEVVSVASGEEALATYRETPDQIDAVILDLKLNGMSGIETFEQLRQLNHEAKIIVSSGDPHHPDVREMVAQGACGVLSKPFRPNHLEEVVKQIAG